jgi:hypothetical protein
MRKLDIDEIDDLRGKTGETGPNEIRNFRLGRSSEEN